MDREYEEVYLLRQDAALETYRPNPVEVDALVRVSLDHWLAFVFDKADRAQGTLLQAGSGAIEPITISKDQLVTSPDRYFARVAVACQRALDGERYIVV
jgi:hypothetical protein